MPTWNGPAVAQIETQDASFTGEAMAAMNRRHFLTTTGAALTTPFLSKAMASADGGSPVLRAAPTEAALLPEGAPRTGVWAYGGSSAATGGTVPGPIIRSRPGGRVRRRFVNDLPQESAVHWHGIRLKNAMDGASGLTQEPVSPGEHFDYDFVTPDPGTYWYHSHNRSWEQMARGLSGPLIVGEAEPWLGLPGAAVREVVLMLDDWYLAGDGQIHEASFGNLHEWAHAGRVGNVFTVNGKVRPSLSVRPGERLRLRMINAANARLMRPRIEGQEGTLIALDGHPVTPRAPGDLILMPAQRADLVIDIPADRKEPIPLLVDLGGGDRAVVAELTPEGTPVPAVAGPVRPLPAWPSAGAREPDLDAARDLTLRMEGGAMGNLSTAVFEGRERPFEELVAAKQVWAFNGTAGGGAYGMGEPLFRLGKGETVRLAVVNDTAFAHGIHVHGHHFTLLDEPAGLSVGLGGDRVGDVRDTLSSWPGETARIAFKADNPGRWLLHCHMLEHQASGMLGWFEVG